MKVKNLMKNKTDKEVAKRGRHPLSAFHGEMNRLFDDFFGDFGSSFDLIPWKRKSELWEGISPSIDVSENDSEVRVSAELPGIDEKDLDVTLQEGMLTIRGEKKLEHEQKKGGYHQMERSYGSFSRSVALPSEINANQVKAHFKKGVLNIILPKTETAKENTRKIHIKAE